jgi:ATP-dependent protease ClpP protease subunit
MPKSRNSETWVDNFMMYGVDLRRRWMFAGLSTIRENSEGEVGYSLMANFSTCLHLLEYEAENPAIPITIELTGYGGDYYHALGIHNRIKQTQRNGIRVHVNAYGPTMSGIPMIGAAADVFQLSSETYLQVHWPSTEIVGRFTRAQLMETVRHNLDTYDTYVDIFWPRFEKKGGTKRQLIGYIDRGTTFTAQRAVQLGFADGIIND